MAKIIMSPRYVIDITGTDLLSSGELEGGGLILINQKVFLTYEGVILTKFDVWNDIVSQSSYFKIPTGFGDIGGSFGGT